MQRKNNFTLEQKMTMPLFIKKLDKITDRRERRKFVQLHSKLYQLYLTEMNEKEKSKNCDNKKSNTSDDLCERFDKAASLLKEIVTNNCNKTYNIKSICYKEMMQAKKLVNNSEIAFYQKSLKSLCDSQKSGLFVNENPKCSSTNSSCTRLLKHNIFRSDEHDSDFLPDKVVIKDKKKCVKKKLETANVDVKQKKSKKLKL